MKLLLIVPLIMGILSLTPFANGAGVIGENQFSPLGGPTGTFYVMGNDDGSLFIYEESNGCFTGNSIFEDLQQGGTNLLGQTDSGRGYCVGVKVWSPDQLLN